MAGSLSPGALALLEETEDEGIRPAIILREYLQRARANGRTFEEAWQFAVVHALRDLPKGGKHGPRVMWSDIFATTRGVWKAAYERTDSVAWLDAMRRLEDAE